VTITAIRSTPIEPLHWNLADGFGNFPCLGKKANTPTADSKIERKLAEDNARPIIFYNRNGTCEQPYVKGLTITVNSIFKGWRMEDVWLDK
jgi:hypothetical protein